MYVCQTFYCVTDLETSRETNQLSFIVSVFVCHYSCTITFPIFFYFIQSEERTSTPWGGKGGEGRAMIKSYKGPFAFSKKIFFKRKFLNFFSQLLMSHNYDLGEYLSCG